MNVQNTGQVNNMELAKAVQRFYETKLVVNTTSPQINEMVQSGEAGTMTNSPLINRYNTGTPENNGKPSHKKENKSTSTLSDVSGNSVMLSEISPDTNIADIPHATSFVHGVATYEDSNELLDDNE